MIINVRAPAFGITSVQQFSTNFQAAIPILNIVIGCSRISSTYAEDIEEVAQEKSEKSEKSTHSKSSTSVNLWAHRVRGVVEILGGGIVILALEITALVLQVIIKLIKCLIDVLCVCLFGLGVCVVAIIGAIAFCVVVVVKYLGFCSQGEELEPIEVKTLISPDKPYPTVVYV